MNRFFFVIILLFSFNSNSFSQSLIYKSNGNVYNAQMQRLSPDEVRKNFSIDRKDLDLYNSGRVKKTVGNVLLIGGIGLITTDLFIGFTGTTASNPRPYPSALTYIGATFVCVAIPIKIGFSKKIKTAVNSFNELYPNGTTANISNSNDLEFVANGNGLGFRLTLN